MKIGPFNISFSRKSLSDPSPEEFSLFTGLPAGALDPMTMPAVQSCIRLISEAAASLDLIVEERDADGNWNPVPDHPVAVLLADRPNDWSSTFGLIRDLVAQALTIDKGAVAHVNRMSGEIREVSLYQPSNVVVEWTTDGRAEPRFRINNNPIDAADVIYLRGPFTRSALSMAYTAIQAGLHMERHAVNLFKNGARPGGQIKTPKNMGDDGVKRMLSGWKAAQVGSENGGGTPVFWDGAEFVPFTFNSTDAQFLENRKYQVLDVCRAFRVPPSMVYELDRATWSNGEQQGKEFLSYSLEPWLISLESSLRFALFSADDRRAHRIRFDRDDLTRADLTARATAISSLISSRTLSPNEGRGWLGLAPREGGNTYENPNTGSNQPGAAAPQEKPDADA